MAELDATAIWAALLLVALPLTVVGLGEIQERARQRRSPLLPVVSVVRIWVVPLAVTYTIVRVVFDVDEDAVGLALVGTAALVAIAVATMRIVGVVVDGLRDRPLIGGERPVPQLLLALPRALVWGALIWLLLGAVWGVDVSGALTALGVTSLIISFALQDTLSGLASGLLLLGDQPFQPGDWIKYGSADDAIEGRVVDISWRSTRLEDRDGDLNIDPNALLANAALVNFDRPTRFHRVKIPVQVAFANPPGRASEMLLAAANATPGVLADPAPNVVVVQVDDPLMGYEVHLWIDDYARRPQVAGDFGALVWYWSERLGVSLPSPAMDFFIHDAADAAGVTTPEQLRARLQTSPLLAQLDDAEIARLADAARQYRFAAGELIVSGSSTEPALHLLVDGAARLVVTTETGTIEVADLTPGDLFGVHSVVERGGALPDAIAIDDCEVVIVDGTTAGAIASRNPALAAALNRLATSRQRRAERALVSSRVNEVDESAAELDDEVHLDA